MKRHLISTTLLGLIALLPTGCENVVPDPGQNPGSSVTAGGSLKSFSSREEFENYFRSELTARNSALSDQNMLQNRGDEAVSAPGADASGAGGNPAAPASPPSAESADSLATDSDGGGAGYSTTTVQEVGVDEADVVKTDGTYLYLIDDNAGENSKLRIVRANPASQLAVVSEIDLEGYGREIYLQDGKLIAITATFGGVFYDGAVALGEPAIDVAQAAGGGSSGSGAISVAPLVTDGSVDAVDAVDIDDSLSDEQDATDSIDVVDVIVPPIDFAPNMYRYERPHVTVTVVDVSDTANPGVVSKTTFDGSATTSRMIDGKLHMILANYQNYFFDVMPRLGMVDFAATSVDVDQVLPTYERTGADGTTSNGELLTWSEVYRPSEPDGFGVVSILSLDASNTAADKSGLSAVGIVAEPGLIYSSIGALYLTNTNYDWQNNLRTTTDVHKFDYVDGRAVPVATGQVPGRILNQYSMGEHNGYLRVATTVDPVFGPEGQITESHNNVYCLQQVGDELQIVGRVENIAPRETIQSARFVGTRGYVVTFEQVDPLFTLDLSDPTNPRIVGELKVPGFSTFIRPLDENHLLTVGQYIPEDDGENFRPWGVQLSIFDVTDFANPVQTHQVVLGGDAGAWSEALYDPKALTYFEEGGLLALPLSIYPKYDYSNVPPPIEVIDPLPIEGEVRPDPVTTTDVEAENVGSGAVPAVTTGTDVVDLGDPVLVSADGEVLVDLIDTFEYVEPTLISPGFDGLVVYRVSGSDGFSELGRIATNFEQEGFYSWNSYARGVFIAENVFAVTNQGVRGAPVSNVASAPYELFYGQMYPIEVYDDVVYIDGGGSTGSDGIAVPVSDEDADIDAETDSGEVIPADIIVGTAPVKK